MKKILLSSFGDYSKRLCEIMKDPNLDYPFCYISDNIDLSKTNEVDESILITVDLSKRVLNGEILCVNMKSGLKLIFLEDENFKGQMSQYSFKPLDINKKWTLSYYDGSTDIEYIEDYVLVSEKYNYYKKK